MKVYFISFALVLLTACSTNTGRYQQSKDSTPTRKPTSAELVDAVPRAEKHSRGGNKSTYQVRGIKYNVMPSADNFSQTGTASWYGEKFHGHLTSNGEIYDMYSMSAAHKNLPLPTYVKVVNNKNQKSVIVRVNDRGPFHQDRVIDLSYSAAYKLGMLSTGTANVTITAITDFTANTKEKLTMASPLKVETAIAAAVPKTPPLNTPQLKDKLKGTFIQVFATENGLLAAQTANAITSLFQINSIWPKNNGIFRVQLGPIEEEKEVDRILANIRSSGYPNAFKVK